MKGLLLILGVYLTVEFTSGFLYRDEDYESPEDAAIFPLMKELGENLDFVFSVLNEGLGIPTELDELFEVYDVYANASAGCKQCVAGMQTIMRVLENRTYEEIRDPVMAICLNITWELEGWNGTLVCPGAVDSWGPHVVYIAQNTPLEADEACLVLNSCQPDEVDPEVSILDLAVPPVPSLEYGPRLRRTSRVRDLNNTIKVVHLTDAHIEPRYKTGASTTCNMPFCCRDEYPGEGYALPWGDYQCNAPPQTVDEFLKFFAAMSPDYLMYTGDSAPNTVWEETQEWQLNMSRLISDKISQFLPGVSAHQTIGNHDSYPTNLYYMPRPEMPDLNRQLYLMWETKSGFGPEQMATMDKGGYYSVVIQPGLRVLSYNSNFQATSNYYILMDQENNGYGEMKQFMNDTFNTARANGEKVILLGHHLSGGGGRVREYSDFITDVTRRNGDLIVLHLLGHSHSDGFKMNTDLATGQVFDVENSGPSINGQTEVNPTAKIFYLDPVTYDCLEVEAYYIDLQNPLANTSNPNIQLSYRATEEYNMVDFTPASVGDFVTRMETDDVLYNKYRSNHETKTGFEGTCEGECRDRMLKCNMRTTSYTEEQQCNENLG